MFSKLNRLILFCCLLFSGQAFAQQTLYAVSGASGVASTLYKINPVTGTLTGTIGSTGITHIVGLASHPTSGAVYAYSNAGGKLYLINANNASVILIGTPGLQVADLAFSPSGVLYAWAETGEDLYTVNTSNGTMTKVGECGCTTSGVGLAFNSAGQLYMKTTNKLFPMNTTTGLRVGSGITLSSTTHDIMSFDVNDALYTGTRGTGNLTLKKINISTGALTTVGTVSIANISAIAFGKDSPPQFSGGGSQSLSICQDAGPISLNSLLSVNDLNIGQVLNWTIASSSLHGSLGGFSHNETSNGGTVSPSGLTYSPSAGYSGSDAFTINIFDGLNTATTTINVTINALPVVNAGTDQTVCSGGTITLSGSGALTYAWDHSVSNGVAFVPPSTATYTLTGTDNHGCVNTDQVNVTVNARPIVDAGPDQTVCPGATVTLSGTGASSYSWDNGITDGAPFTASSTTTYIVNGTDGNGCANTDQVTVTVYALPAVDAGADQSVCAGGAVTLSASGASSYSWDNGITDGDPFSPSASATYTVTGTDAHGCVNTDDVTVTVNALPVVSAGADIFACPGAMVTLSGTGAATYSWDNGISDGTPFAASSATYTVTGTDANGCSSTDDVAVIIYAIPPVDAGTDQSVCSGASVTLSASGADSYTWDNGVTDGDPFSATTTTTYTVTGTDGHGCTNTDQMTVTVNALPNVSANATEQEVCAGSTVTLSGSGADSYTWDNGETDAVPFNIYSTITYTVTGADGNGCTNTDDVTITVHQLPNVNAGSDVAVCDGTDVTLSATGAQSYTWDQDVTDGVSFTPAGSNTYTVTGTDAFGCINTDQVTVSVNALPTLDAGGDAHICVNQSVTLTAYTADPVIWTNGVSDGVPFTPSATTTYTASATNSNGCTSTDEVTVYVHDRPTVYAGADQTICLGEPVTLSGSGAEVYYWDNSAADGIAFAPTTTATYHVTGVDIYGCANSDEVTVTVNALPAVDAGADQAVCEGGTAILSGSGAASYTWDNAIVDSDPFTPVTTATYTVTGTDANGCVNTDEVTVTVNPLPSIGAGDDFTVCEGSTITLGGIGIATFSWDNGVTDGVGFVINSTTTYTVTGTDVNGCSASDQATVTVNPLPAVDAGTDQVVCAESMVTLSGAGALSYSWDNGVNDGVPFTAGTQALTGTVCGDAIEGQSVTLVAPPGAVFTSVNFASYGMPFGTCGNFIYTPCHAPATKSIVETLLLGHNNATIPVQSGIFGFTCGNPRRLAIEATYTLFATPNGIYTVTGTDANGCSNTDEVSITVNPLPTVDAGSDQAICDGSSAMLTASGAASYTWDNAVFGAENLVASGGIYTVTGTDNNGCSNTDAVEVTINPLPGVDAGTDQTVCAGSTVTLNATGADSYSWDNGVSDGVSFVATTTTTYTVTGVDANGCSNTDQVTITVNPLPTVDAGADFAVCAGASATLSGSGADSYSWTGGVTDGLAFSPAATDQYTVTGIDVNGCFNTDEVTVTVNPLPLVDAGNNQTTCAGSFAVLTASGASTYVWSNSVSGAQNIVTSGGTYNVTGTDLNGCSNTDDAEVTINALPGVDAGADQTVCAGSTVTLTATGADSYSWDNGVSNGVSFVATTTTTYTVSGTDANGCSNTDQVTVTVNDLPQVNAGADFAICAGSGPITLSGTGADSYVWDNSVTNGSSFEALSTTTYTVTGTDANGCINTDDITVTVNSLPVVSGGSDQTVCSGTAVTLSGAGADNYSWNNGITDGVAFTANHTVATGTVCGSANDNDTLFLVAPAGSTFTAVNFASYGTPVGNCGSFAVSGCHAASSLSVIESMAIGQDTLRIVVNSSLFGETCSGWDKRLAVTLTYSSQTTATDTYVVTGTDGNGCTATDTVQVVTRALPQVTAGPDVVACGNKLVTLAGSGAVNYIWNNGVTNGVPFFTATDNTYTVVGIDAYGCAASDQVSVTKHALPTVVATNDFSTCPFQSYTLEATGASIYHWSDGTNPVSPHIAAYNSAVYTVVGVDTAGCSNFDQTLVIVYPMTLVDAGPDRTICPGTSVTLTATGAATYNWSEGVVNGVPFVPTVSKTYVVFGTDSHGCVSSDLVNVEIYKPWINPGGSVSICSGEQLTISTVPGASTYTWKRNGVGLTPKTNPISVSQAGTYTVSFTDPVCGMAANLSVNVTTKPAPAKPTITPSTVKVCDGETATVSGPSGFYYQWYDNAGVVLPGATDQSYSSTVTANVKLVTTGTNGCSSPISGVAKITVNPMPIAGFYIKAVNNNGSLQLSANQTNASYIWYLNGSPISGASSINYTATQSGIYSLTVTKPTGCYAVSNDTTITVNYSGARGADENSGLAEEETVSEIGVYPNPSNGLFHIQAEGALKAIVRDIQGRIVFQKEHTWEVDLNNQPTGIYLLQLFDDADQLVKTERLNKR